MSVLLDGSVKVSCLALMALGVAVGLRHQSAALRHWVLSVAIVCALATPWLGLVVPSWHVGVERFSVFPASRFERSGVAINATTVLQAPAGAVRPARADRVATPPSLTVPAVLWSTWLVGAGLSLLLLLIGLARLRWLASASTPVEQGRWLELTEEISCALGLRRRVVLLQSHHATLLVTWGLVRPRILLPPTARDWQDDRIRVVLRHELAHIQRGDWVVQLAAEILRACHWFNPLVWAVSRRVRQESELACDDVVLAGGIEGSTYAAHLLDLARTLYAAQRHWLPASAMARPSHLEGRITAMLNTRLPRSPLTRSARVATFIAVLTVAAAIAGAQSSFFTLSGWVLDPTNRVLPDTRLVLTNTRSQGKYEVRSDGSGHFEFVGLPSADYVLDVWQAGFATFQDDVTIAGRNVDRTVTLQVGSLEETITVTSQVPAGLSAEQLQVKRQRAQDNQRFMEVRQRALDRCTGGAAGPLGGNILPPTKLTDVRPVYPEPLKDAHIEGVVTMEALIGTDGNVRDVRTLAPPSHPDLESAAVEAVRQWQFSQTLLNCVPIEVRMRVTAHFVVRP